MWWRVKEWTLESTLVEQVNGDPPTQNTYNATAVVKVTDLPISYSTAATVEKETDLIIAGKAETSLGQLGPEYSWNFGLSGSNQNLSIGDEPFPAWNLNTLIVGPMFLWEVGADDGGFVSTSGTYETVGAIDVRYCGISFSAPIKRTTPLPDPLGLFHAVSLSSTLTATEYWPYDPKDGGGPIYRSTNGRQLRQFPN